MVIQTYGLAEDELMHYGVLGMRWGHKKAYKQYVKEQRHSDKADYYTRRSKESGLSEKKKAKFEKKSSIHSEKAKVHEKKKNETISDISKNISDNKKAALKKLGTSKVTDPKVQKLEQKAKKQLAKYADEKVMRLEREANAYIKAGIAVASISTGTMVGVGMATGVYFVGKAGVGVAAGGAMIGAGADTLKERKKYIKERSS